MITCNQCIERMKPDDPRVRSGTYHMCGCDYCNKPTYYRELEKKKEESEVNHIYIYEHSNISNRQAARLSALENQYSSLKKLFNERADKKKKVYNKYLPYREFDAEAKSVKGVKE